MDWPLHSNSDTKPFNPCYSYMGYFFFSNFYYIRNIYNGKTNVCMVGINGTS